MAKKIAFTRIYRSEIGNTANHAQDTGYLYIKRRYDETGNLLWEVQYNRTGQEESITDYYYNQDNKVIEKRLFYPNDNTEEKTLYSYNKSGLQEEECLFYDNELYIKQKTLYNKLKQQTAIESYDSENTLTGKEVFRYNKHDKLTCHAHYNELNEKDWEITFFYNDNNQCIKEIHDNIAEGIKETLLLKYNEAGKNTRSESIDANGNTIGYVEVSFNDKDLPVKYVSETLNYGISKIINQLVYNDAGKITENEYFDVLNSRLISRESYTYDEEGNTKTEEQYEFDSQSGRISQYRLQYMYEYYI